MKLGASYNVFDGEELLEGSLKQIKNCVDYISVVYQQKSNYGDFCTKTLLETLNNLKEKGLIDDLVEYIPSVTYGPHYNELEKRNIGLEYSKKNNCTHHISMDTDEYYLTEEFIRLKEKIIEGDYDSSYCQMKTYYKSWEYVITPPEEYFVPLIYKIKVNTNYQLGCQSPVLVDPTRRMANIQNPLILKRDDLEMHHGSYIRNDIRKKLINSSALVNFSNEVDKLITHYQNWEYPNEVFLAGNPCTLYKVNKIENNFN